MKKIRPVLICFMILFVVVNFVLGISSAIDFSKTHVLSQNLTVNPQEVAGVVLVLPNPRKDALPPPVLSATGVYVFDLDANVALFAKDPNLKVPIASTTKIMTALVSAEHFDQNQTLKVLDLSGVSGSSMGLRIGEEITFRSLLYGMLLNSGNDAAFVIAQNYPGGVSGFVTAMNNKARDINLQNTHFTNPAGFDDPGHYSSALDLAKMTSVAYQNPLIARAVATRETVVASVDKGVVHNLLNLNKLLDLPGVIGFKTGYTNIAKENLVALMEKDNHKILTVVLGSDDRFGETKALMDWVFANFEWPAQ